MKFVSKDGLRYYHQKYVLPAIKSHVNRINITGQTLDVNTLTLSDGSSNKAEYIEKTNGGAANITNIPVTNLPFVLVVELIRWASASDYITKQTFYTSTSTYSRICTSGSWSNWAQLIFTDTKYTHPTTSGNKHIPSGGSSGQILRWDSDGTATWGSDSDTKNTAGSTNSSSKLFLIGATSQAANPQTYSHDTVYVGTNGHLYSNSKQVVNLSDSQALTNKTYNGYTLAAACAKAVTDSSSASAIGTGASLVTERDVYYGLPTINGAHNYTSSTSIYAPTAVGTSGYILKSGGSGAPSWVAQSSLAVGSATKATKDSDGNTINTTYLKLTGGTITADSNNSTYGKAALNIANKTSGSSTIFPSISFMQIGVSDANLVMKNGIFYRTVGSSTDYFRIYDSETNELNDWVNSAAFGYRNEIDADSSFAIGRENFVNKKWSAAFGYQNTVNSSMSTYPLCYALGGNNTVTGGYGSIAIGTQCTVKGQHAIATGDYSSSNAWCTVAMGNTVTASGECQTVFGHYNIDSTSGSTSGTGGNALIIGNGAYTGTGTNTLSNAFRVTFAGLTYAKGAYSSSGADYAEYFEWEDSNPNNEDRRGLFVTFSDNNKIRIANESDQYILGIVSGKPVIVGNIDDDQQWAQRFLKDEYGEFIMKEFEQKREVKYIDEKTGKEKIEIVTEMVTYYVENPEYDPTKEYIPRENRPEWSPIGMLGVLSVRDDGSCVVGGYCKCTKGGIATHCDEYTLSTYRVIERVTDNIVKIVIK